MCCPFVYACIHVFTYILANVCMCTHMSMLVEGQGQYQKSLVVSPPYSLETGSLTEIVLTRLWTD